MSEAEMFIQCCDLFSEACLAFERGDTAEHYRLRIAHRKAADLHQVLVERERQSVH